MTIISLTGSLSSELSGHFGAVSFIDIEEECFDSGSFGEVFLCRSLNGSPPRIRQAAKLFIDEADSGYRTIQDLQRKLRELSPETRARVDVLAGLQALPQLSFRGAIQGKTVAGYLSNYLEPSRFTSFDSMFEDSEAAQLRRLYARSVPISCKLNLGRQLAESTSFLRDLGFIHADINAQNILIDTAAPSLALIDFDSGAVTDDVASMPSTWGKPNEWVAPEILEQLRGHEEVSIDLFTDTWSVAVGIYYMIFLWPPYCFLEQQSITDLRSYFLRNKWPEIPTYNLGSRTAVDAHRRIIAILEEKPYLQQLYQRFQQTFNAGALHPGERTTYYQWVESLRAAEAAAGVPQGSVAVVPGSSLARQNPARPKVLRPSPVTVAHQSPQVPQQTPITRPTTPSVPVQASHQGPPAGHPAPICLSNPPSALRRPPSLIPQSVVVACIIGLVIALSWLALHILPTRQRHDGKAISEAPDLARQAEALRIAEHERVARGLSGEWHGLDSSGRPATLSIQRSGAIFTARIPVEQRSTFYHYKGVQVMHGSLLANDQLALTNDNYGKLVNPAEYYSGDFSEKAWIQSNGTGSMLYVRFSNIGPGPILVFSRKPSRPEGSALSQRTEPQTANYSGSEKQTADGVEQNTSTSPPVASDSPGAVEPPTPPPAPSVPKTGDFVVWGELDRKPNLLSPIKLSYPPDAVRNKVEGAVELRLDIDETGHVTSARVLSGPSPDWGLNTACERAAMALLYTPGYKGNVAVKTQKECVWTLTPPPVQLTSPAALSPSEAGTSSLEITIEARSIVEKIRIAIDGNWAWDSSLSTWVGKKSRVSKSFSVSPGKHEILFTAYLPGSKFPCGGTFSYSTLGGSHDALVFYVTILGNTRAEFNGKRIK